MVKKDCIICNKGFEAVRKTRTCSLICSELNYKNLQAKWNNWEYKKKFKTDKVKIREYNKKWHKRKYDSDDKFKKRNKIRSNTQRKYGILPEGFQYHHIPPYHTDVWIGVYRNEHKLFDSYGYIF